MNELLGFAVDPIKPFLATATSLRDLWARCWITSRLVAAGLRAVSAEQVIYPAVREADPHLPVYSNRFLALVPEAGRRAKEIEAAVRKEWAAFALDDRPWWVCTWQVTPFHEADYRDCFDRNQRGLGQARAAKSPYPGPPPGYRAEALPRHPAGPPEGAFGLLVMDMDRSGATIRPVGVTPEFHRLFSARLAAFARDAAPRIVENHGGFPIYVGGDDVVAALPRERSLAAAREIRARFAADFPETTMSASLIRCPAGAPVDGLMTRAWSLLDRDAKERGGRDAIAILEDGHPPAWVGRWGEIPVVDESWYRRPPGLPDRTAAGGVVLRDGRLVALTRARGVPGFILPKGGVDRGESLEEAARRETFEETGISRLRLVRKLGERGRLDLEKVRWTTVHWFLFETDQVEAHPPDDAHPSMGWFPLDELPEIFWPDQHELIRNMPLRPTSNG